MIHEQLQLPFAFDIERTAPAPVVRSALFGIVKRGTRRYVEREVVASWGNDSIIYTGCYVPHKSGPFVSTWIG
jgi:hypothetical protein